MDDVRLKKATRTLVTVDISGTLQEKLRDKAEEERVPLATLIEHALWAEVGV